MKYADFLKDQGNIGFVAPSFGCVIEPYRTAFGHALEVLKKKGFTVKLGPNVYASNGLGISNTPEKCAAEFEEWYCSGDTDVLISCGGGELMCEILPHISFENLANAPAKWFMGYSDNTNLVFTLTTICDAAAIYGPCGPTFGMEPWHSAIKDALDLLQGKILQVGNYDGWEMEGKKDEDHPLEPYTITEPFKLRTWHKGREDGDVRMEGRLVGGCLDSLANLCGTTFDQVEKFAKRYEKDGLIFCKYELLIHGGAKEYEIICKILDVRDIPNRNGEYEYRIHFVNLDNDEREEIIQYIFEEERKNRRKERGFR